METYKKIALSFLELIALGKIEEAYQKYISQEFRHHNPYFFGDADSLKKGMLENEAQHPGKILEVKHALQESDFVVVHSHLRFKREDAGMIVVHIFRFKEDKIVELWDVGQEIPRDNKNLNGPF